MLRYVTSLVVEHSDHPYLMGMLLIGGLLALSGIAVQMVAQNGLIGGFLIVYAMIAFFLAALGYGVAIGGKLIRTYTRETDASL